MMNLRDSFVINLGKKVHENMPSTAKPARSMAGIEDVEDKSKVDFLDTGRK
jgi:hypothetical protein